MQSGRFSTNDPRFDPARCTPDPAPAAPSIPYPIPLGCVLVAAGIALHARRTPATIRRDPQPRGRGAAAAALWYHFATRRGVAAPGPAAPPSGRPSISRALDDLKHEFADQVIGRKLGDHQAAQLSAAITGNPAPAPAPTPAPAATPAGAPG